MIMLAPYELRESQGRLVVLMNNISLALLCIVDSLAAKLTSICY